MEATRTRFDQNFVAIAGKLERHLFHVMPYDGCAWILGVVQGLVQGDADEFPPSVHFQHAAPAKSVEICVG